MPAKDEIFQKPIQKQFAFDDRVAAVFDDMIERSVPLYKETTALFLALAKRALREGGTVLDLGSSTGNFLIELAQSLPFSARLVGIDNAPAMVALAQKKAQAHGADVCFVEADMLAWPFPECDVIYAGYTLQFVRPLQRGEAVEKIYRALKPGGLFLMSEKVLMEDKWLNKQIIDIYYDYKKSRGYSETEIARKREALENVLVPYTIEENKKMLKSAGFTSVDTVAQWGNFAAFTARKEEA